MLPGFEAINSLVARVRHGGNCCQLDTYVVQSLT